jgi:radical SAM superfamily enzyme YgiQ (UPF0313 family)
MMGENILFRPPGEAGSLIIRVAAGCPWNRCAFCGMYKGVQYKFPGLEKIAAEIARLARGGGKANQLMSWALAREEAQPDARRIFLADGDVMRLEFRDLEQILLMLNARFKSLARVSVYANGASILAKTDDQLRRLRELKLHTLYMGLESGDDHTLKEVNKRETAGDMVRAGERAQAAGLRMSVMALIGLAGKARSLPHARATAQALNRMQPRLLSALRLIVTPNTPLAVNGFKMLAEYDAVAEIREMIAGLELEQTVFRADHSSNIVPLEGRFPKDKQRLLDRLDELLSSGRLDKQSPGPLPFWL